MCIERLNTSSAKNSHPLSLRVLETEGMQYDVASQELWPLQCRFCDSSAAMEIGAITSCNEGRNGPNCHHHRMTPRALLYLSLPQWICTENEAARTRPFWCCRRDVPGFAGTRSNTLRSTSPHREMLWRSFGFGGSI